MLSGNNLQDQQMAREEAKILKRREDNEIRRQRYLQAKVRLIGVDVQALDEQVAEKMRNRQNDRDSDKFARMQAMEIERMLAQTNEEEKAMREFQVAQLKGSWEEARQHKEALRLAPQPKDFDVENAGSASALRFGGEDSSRGQRAVLQKEQMRKWIQEQVAEKAALRHLQKQDDMSFAEMMRAIDDIRDQTEKEEQALRKFIQDSVKEYNLGLAEQQRARNRSKNDTRRGEDGAPLLTSLPAFDESKLLALDDTGRIIRRDMFKGFTDEQKRKILMDNQDILRQKSLQREDEKRREYDWLLHQIMTLRAMEQAEFDEKAMRGALKEDQLAFLRAQIDEQRVARDEWARTRRGDISGGFFDGFGKTCR